MSLKVILHKGDDGGLIITYPTPEALETHTIEEVAMAVVAHGKRFKIVDVTEENFPMDGTLNSAGIPNMDKSFRDAWEVDDDSLTDGVGAESNFLPERLEAKHDQD